MGLTPGPRRSPGEGNGNLPTPVFLPGDSYGQRSLAGYSPWHRKESGMTWQLKTTTTITLNDTLNDIIIVSLFKFYFIFILYKIVLVLPNIKMNPPQVYMCSPSWTLLPPPSPYHPSGLSQCTSPKHPVSCIEPGIIVSLRGKIR